MKIHEKIESVCPDCFKEGLLQKIDGFIVEEKNDIYITKKCEKHGSFKDVYFGDVNLYKKWMKFKVKGDLNPDIKTSLFDDPQLYSEHISQTVLTNLEITNRCNKQSVDNMFEDFVYEPTFDQIKSLMRQAREQEPIGSKSIQITGGEPTLRDDIFDIVKLARDIGFSHIQIKTDGLKLAKSVEYCGRLKDQKVNTIYLDFNGISKKINPFIEENKRSIENLRSVNLEVVLVSSLVYDKNINEIGKIIRFAFEDVDIVKGVYFQPASYNSRKFQFERKEKNQRVNYSDILNEIEKEFKGQISRSDFYPISFVFPISKMIEIIRREAQVELSAHPACGGATFLFIDKGKPIPITRFIDVEGFLNFLIKQSKKKGPLRKLRVATSFYKSIGKIIDYGKAPEGFDLKQIFKDAAIVGSQYALRELRHKTLFIGFMAEQDIFNLDIDRLKRCVIHHTTFEGIIPTCAYHALGYGNKIRKKYSASCENEESN